MVCIPFIPGSNSFTNSGRNYHPANKSHLFLAPPCLNMPAFSVCVSVDVWICRCPLVPSNSLPLLWDFGIPSRWAVWSWAVWSRPRELAIRSQFSGESLLLGSCCNEAQQPFSKHGAIQFRNHPWATLTCLEALSWTSETGEGFV